SDSHTRYGVLGTLAVGEGGGELTKQLVGRTYDIQYPGVTAVYLTGKPQTGVGPHDVAISIIKAVFANGFVRNKVMEFVGDGVANLPVDFRHGIDIMTTETTCWSSIWKTDDKVREWLAIYGREGDYRELAPAEIACYDGLVHVDLAKIEPSIAMPFHPSNVFTIRELRENAADILNQTEAEGRKITGKKNLDFKLISKLRNGHIYVDQGIVGGCAGGTFDNIMAVADILNGGSIGNGAFSMSVYPGSQPIYLDAVKNGAIAKIMMAGALLRSAFCGPCFGAGDTPADGEFSIRHNTRNFPNREGAKPGEGQAACVALMDARSIAATARNGGRLTAATEIQTDYGKYKFFFDKGIYDKRVYDGTGKPDPGAQLAFGPNIKDWPAMPALTEDLLLKVASYITDPVTTTDELIPSGETASFRSNPLRLAEFTLARRDPLYLGRAKDVHDKEIKREEGKNILEDQELARVYAVIRSIPGHDSVTPGAVGIGSTIYAHKPGDGSAREQAASCQRVLGASANLAREYATKRYRSNLINWGILPFLVKDETAFALDDYIFIPGIKKALLEAEDPVTAYVISGDKAKAITISLGQLTDAERRILSEGCLINYYRNAK
ncbi:MAG: hydratase, partial [Deltaproteobacteria bacterium]|nr:hydratase [Deltaproteobacteria bacterium]